MKRFLLLFVLLTVLALGLPAFAQDEDADEYGDNVEVALYGGTGLPGGTLTDWNDSLGATSGFNVGFDIGYFVTAKLVMGLNFTYTQFNVDATDRASETKHQLYSPNLFAKYYFEGESNFVPYLKAHLGFENPKFTTTAWNNKGVPIYRQLSYSAVFAGGLGAGLFLFTSDFGGLFVEGNYHYANSKDASKDYGGKTYLFNENLSTIDIHAGVRILFGSGGE